MSIIDMNTNSTTSAPTIREKILSEMKESEFRFVLTGSRLFGDAYDKSDWDFFISYTTELEKWLLDKGFKWIDIDKYGFGTPSCVYNDMNTASVFSHECGIDVQIPKNFPAKKICQFMILDKYLNKYLGMDKQSRKILWDKLYDDVLYMRTLLNNTYLTSK